MNNNPKNIHLILSQCWVLVETKFQFELSSFPLLDPDADQEPIRLQGEIPSPSEVVSGCPFHSRCPRFLGEICAEDEPPWQEGENGQHVYCHIPLEELRLSQKKAFRFQGGSRQSQPDGEDG